VYHQLENFDLQEVFLTETKSFSQRNIVPDDPASNTEGFLSRHTCISSTQLNRPIWNKESLSPL
jgi:hypothetical protein